MTVFTHKYSPKHSKQVFGQQKAVEQLKDFIEGYKQQKFKAALCFGPIGCGKTSAIYAIAKELKYDLLEINSSNLRNKDNITSFLSAALGQQSLFFTPKIILIDEIDNISGVKDRGCIPALLKAIQKASFPVILTANDPSDKKFKSLRKVALPIEFHKLQYRTIAHGLEWVAQQENIEYEEKAILSLARQVDGDMRAALLDLQVCSADGKFTFDDVINLSDRKRTDSIKNALRVIFKSSSIDNALRALDDVDADMDHVFFWIENNLPREYLSPKALAKAYEHLARADVFRGRIRRWQHWRFMVYIYNLLTAGISSAKDEKNPMFVEYKQTMRLLRIWQANMKWAKKKDIAKKLAAATHTSKKVALKQMPYFQAMFRKSPQRDLAAELELTDDEVAWLRK
ncbi:replication factor C large subunit [Candidatus Woesearchaeota archaeon]|nr:replication factor C large subunit [Candidatus Woesearchaeota archaeon]MBT5739744.1 replication factor C large subunit [Candidatus Woesearchaeota archaeon]